MVATDWAPVIQTGIGAAAALGGGFVGAWWQGRAQQRVERDRRRERAAEVLAEVTKLLDDSVPVRLALRRRPSEEVLQPVMERRETVRGQLLVLAAGHPSRHVRSLARQLDVSIFSSLISTGYWIDMRHGGEDQEESRKRAEQDFERAQGLLEELLEAI